LTPTLSRRRNERKLYRLLRRDVRKFALLDLGLDAEARELAAALHVLFAKNASVMFVTIALEQPSGQPPLDGFRRPTDTPRKLRHEHRASLQPRYPYPPFR